MSDRTATSGAALGLAKDPPDLATMAMAVVTLLVDERQARMATTPGGLPTEVLLHDAGLSSSQIAALVRKTPGTVRKDLSRARQQEEKKKAANR